MIFQRDSFDMKVCFEMSRIDLAWRVKVESWEQVASVVDIIGCLGRIEKSKKLIKQKEVVGVEATGSRVVEG